MPSSFDRYMPNYNKGKCTIIRRQKAGEEIFGNVEVKNENNKI
jgi:hypothetical protein